MDQGNQCPVRWVDSSLLDQDIHQIAVDIHQVGTDSSTGKGKPLPCTAVVVTEGPASDSRSLVVEQVVPVLCHLYFYF